SYTLGSIPAGLGATLNHTATAEQLVVTSAAAVGYYWKGDKSSVWNTYDISGNTNWYTDTTGTTNVMGIPVSTTNVFFTVTSGATNLTNTLGADTSILSLNFTSASGSVTIGGANTLTIGTGGITNLSSNTQTLSTNVILGSNQTWLNNGGLFNV